MASTTRRQPPEVSIPFTVLGGYLGAGKTTLVNHLLQNADGERLALIINDFGAINIDAELISEQTDDQINLTNGCICCGMSAGFDEALESLLDLSPRPDRIIVEASGVADVTSLAQYGHHPGLHLDGIIVLADAETVRAKARDKYVDKTVLRQLRGADLLVLNKVDLISQEKLGELKAWLAGIAPGTPLLTSCHSQVPAGTIFGVGHAAAPEAAHDHAGHETYVTWHHNQSAAASQEAVEAFVAALPAGVLRGKGFFRIATSSGDRALLYQQVGKRVTLSPEAATPRQFGIVIIGLAQGLATETLDALAERHLD